MNKLKKSFFTRLTGLLLVAGFFYSCSTTQPSVDQLLNNKNYQQALTSINNQLAEDPAQPDLYIQKAKIHAILARDNDPEVRAEYYESAVESFNAAGDYQPTTRQQNQIDSLRQQYWKFEHNLGLQASENEELDEHFQRATIHFQNALILQSDAVSTYKSLAITQFKMGELDVAIATYRRALSASDNPPPQLYENLGYLYLEKGDPEQAAYYYELANKSLENDLNTAFGLINAYVSNGNHTEAVEILKPLVEENPDNAGLRNVYGTQLYEITEIVIGDLKAAYRAQDSALVSQLRFEAEGTGEQAEQQLIEAFRRDTANVNYLESLAVFYNNLSAQYLSLQKVVFSEDLPEIRSKAYTLIDFAIDYYEKLSDANPDNEQYQAKLSTLENLKAQNSASPNN
ncbi:tetratricopeptide repeat protein [Gracilimonas mengyeensis]|uniref:Tetratricopeptide repeat-containing protein n=1 Tax=Gracilimonas mengyeensis TaxID=1302730 RepID=A0A521FH06_9BACT|nr:tetratricopeptide repeat protein [Gracilimonas mengyeensis]SMO94931.1 Tetratricopeptide repeat-containing protein [Gracilimonas mengyeensis]